MRRFTYRPTVHAYIKLEDSGTVINISDDIVSGSIERRLNAMSTASIVLQNKFGKYTGGTSGASPSTGVLLQPMDRIIILMSRVGDPQLVFSGYIDAATVFQLYPDTVDLQASCSLKTLQYTYFDPGLPFLRTFFGQFGLGSYDPTTGLVTDFSGTNQFGNLDVSGGIGRILYAVLTEIAGWDPNQIKIKALPIQFLDTISEIMRKEIANESADIDQMKARLIKFLTPEGISGDLSGTQPTSPNSAVATGNITANQVAKLAAQVGFTGDDLVIITTLAQLESGNLTSNSNAQGATGLWQIFPTDNGGSSRSIGYTNPFTGVTQTIAGTIDTRGSTGQPAMSAFLDPLNNAKAAYSLYSAAKNKYGQQMLASNQFGGFTSTLIPARFHDWAQSMEKVNKQVWVDAANAATTAVSALTNSQSTPSGIGTNDSSTIVTTPTGTFKVLDGTTQMQTGGKSPYSNLQFESQVDWLHVDPTLLEVINTVAQQSGTLVLIISGYRSNSYSSSVGGFAGDPHTKGLAIDAYILGVPIGQVISSTTWRKYGVRAGIDFTPTDPEHLDLMNAAGTAPNSLVTNSVAYAGTAGTGGTGNLLGSTGPITAAQVAGISVESGFFAQQLLTSDSTLSQLLTGTRALSNDISVMEWVSQLIQTSGRVFMSGPDGEFYAFYPDYFGWFARNPYWKITDLETTNLKIKYSDVNLITHLYATGPLTGFSQISMMDRALSTVASVEDDAFKLFVNTDENNPYINPEGDHFSPIKFLQRFGARPYNYDLPEVRNPVLLWMAAWMQFCLLWANRLSADAEFTFMPEIIPGGRINLDDKVVMFVNSVTHNFDLQNGFTTSAELIAPAGLPNSTKNPVADMAISGRVKPLPQ